MLELVQDNWVLFVVALFLGVLVAWWIFVATRRTRVEVESRDETEPAPARRNQALIDSPPAAAAASEIPPASPIAAAGAGEALARAPTPAAPAVGAGTAEPPTPASPPAGTGASEPPATAGPATEAHDATAEPSPASDGGDELLRIKGLGPRLADQLRALGVTSLGQIAAWDDAEIDRIDAQLGRFQGRIRRDNWPEQARLLSSGDIAAYEARFGKL